MFIGRFENKVDQKGRVSIPAPFRHAVAGQDFAGIVVFPSFKASCLEACGIAWLHEAIERSSSYDTFSDEQDALLTTIFANSRQLPFDGDGRVVLPEDLRKSVGIGKQAAFIGMAKRFQIWRPEGLETHLASAAKLASERGLTLPGGGPR